MRRAVFIVLLMMAAAGPVRAQPPGAPDDDDDHAHVAVAVAWTLGILVPPGLYYWNTESLQKVDWVLGWDWPSWKSKLTSFDHVKWDTNSFTGNVIRHPFQGFLDYQIGRSNGFGALGSEALALGAGLIWEYVIEYPEEPSLNDLIMNPAGGVAIGEPLYQIGQLWRGGTPSIGDRLRVLATSPFDAVQDLWRHHPRARPRAWRSFVFTAGADRRAVDDGGVRGELALGLDLDLVAHPAIVRPEASHERTAVGAWSRVAARVAFGAPSDEKDVATVWFHSRASITGRYVQDAGGDGVFAGLGSAFTYRRDRLAGEWDRVGIAHLIGPQVQVIHGPVRWDVAAYADFSMIQAHVFEPVSILQPPPPLYSSVQAAGYYDGFGATANTRVRVDDDAWHADVELFAHLIRQIDCCDRTDAVPKSPVAPPLVPHGIDDERVYGRAALGWRPGAWGVELEAAGALRRGAWRGLARDTTETRIGVALTYDY